MPGGLGPNADKVKAEWNAQTISRAGTAFLPGPNGLQGEFYHFGGADNSPSLVGYDPERQEWHEHPDGSYWVGWLKEERPAEADLRRPVMVGSYRVRAANQDWWVPICGPVQTHLPKDYTLASGGKMTTKVRDSYFDLWKRSEEVFRVLSWSPERDEEGKVKPGQDEPSLSDEWVGEFAADALAVNYFIDRFLFCVLGMADTQSAFSVAYATVAREAVRPNG